MTIQGHTRADITEHGRNRILAALPQDILAALVERAGTVSLARGRILQEVGEPVREALFPHSGVIALVAPMRDGRTVETAAVGPEGYLGFWAVLGSDDRALCRAVVQVPGTATRLSIDSLLAISRTYPPLTDLLLRFSKVLLTQSIQAAACNDLHTLEARCARCLLHAHDRVDQDDGVQMSQARLALMLGVRRQSLSAVTKSFQARGVVRLEPGCIRVLDRSGLEAASCECYRVVREAYETILPAAG
ncbi:CRP-like cAMP-binding protein [Microvirga flocculans]|uniref:CRP-like cAMP-binding protein n=1 Tax=Microvirga flocculans TaxID=217168 RepID=A0A7W6N7T5_9HYPH|nr:Crp/Fnr family transcriptional regulator [Microvirga flocculans]MBB4039825.1 CRP-like cAMP-binding protein [Microvirga flocculans]